MGCWLKASRSTASTSSTTLTVGRNALNAMELGIFIAMTKMATFYRVIVTRNMGWIEPEPSQTLIRRN